MFSSANLQPAGTVGLATYAAGGIGASYLAVTEDGKTAYLAGSVLEAPGPIGEVEVGSASALPVYLSYPIAEGGGPMALSRDQTRLFSGDAFNADVSVLDRSSGNVTVFVGNFNSYAIALQVSRDGTKIYELLAPILNCCMNGNSAPPQLLNVLDVATGALTFSIPTFGVNLAVPGSGTLVYSSDGTTTDVIDTAKGAIVGNLSVGGLAIAVSPDGTKLFAAQQNIVVADTSSGSVLETITVPNTVAILVLAVNGQSLYAGGQTLSGLAELAEIGLGNYTITHTRTLAGSPFGLAVSGNGEKILAGLGPNTYIGVIDSTQQVVSHVIASPGSPTPVISADGKSLYLERPNGTVLIHNTATLAVTGLVQPKTSAVGTLLGVTLDGKELILYSAAIHAIIELNASSGTVTPLLGLDPAQTALSPDSRYLYLSCSACFSGNMNALGVIQYDLVPGKITGFAYLPLALFLALSPDGTTLYASTGIGNQYELVALNTAQMTVMFKINVNIESFALSRDGATI